MGLLQQKLTLIRFSIGMLEINSSRPSIRGQLKTTRTSSEKASILPPPTLKRSDSQRLIEVSFGQARAPPSMSRENTLLSPRKGTLNSINNLASLHAGLNPANRSMVDMLKRNKTFYNWIVIVYFSLLSLNSYLSNISTLLSLFPLCLNYIVIFTCIWQAQFYWFTFILNKYDK